MSSIDKKTLDERLDSAASIKKLDYTSGKRSYSISSGFGTDSSDEETTLNHEAYDPHLDWTEEEENQVRRIIDIRLMPFILLMSFVLNMDRTNVSNALSDYMPQDLGFDNDKYNLTLMVYSIVFTLFTLPSTTVAKRIGAHIWIPILMTSWAIVTWAHAIIKNYAEFMVIRVLIAVTEGGFIPACLYYLTSWYKSNELGTRLAFFWGVQSFASAFSGLISFGIFRLRGVGGLEGWKWLFLLDGVFTHVVAFIAFLYLPRGPARTVGLLRGRKGWFDERQTKIAVTRLIRDDKSKTEQYNRVNIKDIKRVLSDTKVWMHLITTFVGFIPQTPISAYFPTIIRDGGFEVTTANLLTMPAYIINLAVSILIAKSADKYGDVGLHAAFEAAWMLAGFIVLRTLPPNANRWSIYAGALISAGAPSWHGMHIAWMSANVAPVGKRSLALGLIIGAANICSVPGAFIYQASDAPKYYYGNTICIALTAVNLLGFLAIRFRYILTNRWREKKWNAMSEEEKKRYNETTKHEGSNRLDFRFRI